MSNDNTFPVRAREAAVHTIRGAVSDPLKRAELLREGAATIERLDAEVAQLVAREVTLESDLEAMTYQREYWEQRHETTSRALARLIEVTDDFLRSEYPIGTDHEADAEAARLSRAVREAAKETA